MSSINEVSELRAKISELDDQYYSTGESKVEDRVYNAMHRRLQQLELFDDIPGSVGYSSSTMNTLEHRKAMLSLHAIYTHKELVAFLARMAAEPDNESIFLVEPKYDGLAVNLTYVKGHLIAASTRGDGLMGESVLSNILELDSIPHRFTCAKGTVEIRGEVIIGITEFNKINQTLVDEGAKPYATPRSMAVGTLRNLNPSLSRMRSLRFIPYGLGYNSTPEFRNRVTQHRLLETFKRIGFSSLLYWLCDTSESVVRIYKEAAEISKLHQLPMDGIVVKLDSLTAQELMGNGTRHPHWAVAYKFENPTGLSTVSGVEWNVSRTGNVVPVLLIDPVTIGGVVVRRASLNNALAARDISVGDDVVVELAGGVIPKIVQHTRSGVDVVALPYPTHCPDCDTRLQSQSVHLVCDNAVTCPGQVESRLLHMTSKEALDVRRFGKAILNQLMASRLLNNGLVSLFTLTVEELQSRGGMDVRAATTLVKAIDTARYTTLRQFMVGLNIPGCGPTTVDRLINRFSRLETILKAPLDDLLAAGLGDKVANGLIEWRDNLVNLRAVSILTDPVSQGGCGIRWADVDMSKLGDKRPLTGITYAFVGQMSVLDKTTAKGLVRALGGTVASGVSKLVDIVVAGDDTSTHMAEALGIDIWDEAGFIEMVKQYQ